MNLSPFGSAIDAASCVFSCFGSFFVHETVACSKKKARRYNVEWGSRQGANERGSQLRDERPAYGARVAQNSSNSFDVSLVSFDSDRPLRLYLSLSSSRIHTPMTATAMNPKVGMISRFQLRFPIGDREFSWRK
jgi:hypothetical protein